MLLYGLCFRFVVSLSAKGAKHVVRGSQSYYDRIRAMTEIGHTTVVLLAATRGRQSASEVLLAQYLGKTLTAAPVSIKYLHLLHLSATYNNLEGNNLGSVASAESCSASVISPGARVATLLWLNSLKKTRKDLDTCVLYHRRFGDSIKQVH